MRCLSNFQHRFKYKINIRKEEERRMAVELEALKNEVAALNEKYAKMQEQKWLLSEQKKELTIETNSLREQLDYQSNKIGLCFSTKEKIDSDIRQVKNKILSQQQRLEEVKTKKNILTAECNKYSQEIKVPPLLLFFIFILSNLLFIIFINPNKIICYYLYYYSPQI